MSIDWDEIKRKHDERVQWEIEQGLRPPPKETTVINKPSTRKPSSAGGSSPTAGKPRPTYSHGKIIRMYQDGMSVKEIADELGCYKQTVYTALHTAKIPLRPYNRSQVLKEYYAKRRRTD